MASRGQSIDLTNTDDERPRKRAKTQAVKSSEDTPKLSSLRASISPPRSRSVTTPATPAPPAEAKVENNDDKKPTIPRGTIITSPFSLTTIRDLPDRLNVDTVTLQSIICDPMISELWEFNYMHDLDFIMSNMDPDTRNTTKINIVHGYWRREDGLYMKEAAPKYPNINLLCAYMPEMFGTHHTKMMVIFRHDDLAQIIIHTANMIQQDWTNMSDAVWRSPLLPLLPATPSGTTITQETIKKRDGSTAAPYGSGTRFKWDFLNYLRAYNKQRQITKPLIERLLTFDFSEIVGALVAHVPGRHSLNPDNGTHFGWPALKVVLKTIPCTPSPTAEIICQVSSIATLGPTPSWLEKTLGAALTSSSNPISLANPKPKLGVVFPTPDEIRKSLDGYTSGGSIHTKVEKPQHQKQLAYMRPVFYHWAGDRPDTPENLATVRLAGRKRAAPHIKTYARFTDPTKPDETEIDWALVTSANLSKQAWGEATNKAGEVRVSSYELGVLIAPSMYDKDAVMVPCFKTNAPEKAVGAQTLAGPKTTIGYRMPYDLPLVKYGPTDEPWCATKAYQEVDWMGRVYDIKPGD